MPRGRLLYHACGDAPLACSTLRDSCYLIVLEGNWHLTSLHSHLQPNILKHCNSMENITTLFATDNASQHSTYIEWACKSYCILTSLFVLKTSRPIWRYGLVNFLSRSCNCSMLPIIIQWYRSSVMIWQQKFIGITEKCITKDPCLKEMYSLDCSPKICKCITCY